MASPENQSPQEKYGLSCPFGGSFYICLSSQARFLGCCETDPCSNGGQCLLGELRPASYVSYPGHHQNCVAPYDEREWYTCDFAAPRFMGCCLQNPCDQGCPDWDLIPAQLDDDPNIAAPFLPSPRDSSAETGRIIGFSIMGVAIALLVLVVVLLKFQRKMRRKIMNIWESFKRHRRSNNDQSNTAYDDLEPNILDHSSSKPESEPSSTSSSGTAHTHRTYGPLRVVNP